MKFEQVEKLNNEKRKLDITERLETFLQRKDKDFEKTISKIDFNILKKIFNRYGERCQINNISSRFVDKKFIRDRFLEDVDSIAAYFPSKHMIKVDVKMAKHTMPEKFFDLGFLHTICHEETHAISGKRHKLTENKVESQIGYEKRIHNTTYNESEILFTYFNEGVTELFARRILKEYLDSDQYFCEESDKKEFIQLIGKNHYIKKDEQDYQEHVNFVNAIIINIAKATGFQETDIEDSLVRGMLEGENLQDPILKNEIEKATYTGFIDDYIAQK